MRIYQRTAEAYKRIFDTAMSEGQPIYSSDGQELILQEDEEFRQCFEANDPVRRDFPKSWFVSDHSSLVSTYRGYPEWLKMDTSDPKRGTYHFNLDGRIKVIAAYNLSALCFNAPCYGNAKERLNEQGIRAYGNLGKVDGIQGHHFKDRKDHPELIYDAYNMGMYSTQAHPIVDGVPAANADEETKMAWMKEFAKVAADEAPSSFSIAMNNNDEKQLIETKQILVTENFLEELQQLATMINTLEKYMFYMPQIQQKQAELNEKNTEKGE